MTIPNTRSVDPGTCGFLVSFHENLRVPTASNAAPPPLQGSKAGLINGLLRHHGGESSINKALFLGEGVLHIGGNRSLTASFLKFRPMSGVFLWQQLSCRCTGTSSQACGETLQEASHGARGGLRRYVVLSAGYLDLDPQTPPFGAFFSVSDIHRCFFPLQDLLRPFGGDDKQHTFIRSTLRRNMFGGPITCMDSAAEN